MSRTARSSLRSTLVNASLALFAFGLLGLAINKNRDQVRDVLRGPLDGRLFAFGASIYLAALMITFYRWFLLVRALDIPFRVRDAFRLGFIGNVFNLVIPGGVGGDLIKAYYLCREQARKAQAIASMAIDRIVGLLGLFLLAGMMGFAAWSTAGIDVRRLIAIIWAAAGAGVLGLIVLFTPALYRPLRRVVAGRGRLESVFDELTSAASTYRERLGVIAVALLLAMGSHTLFVLAFYMASRAMFERLPSLGQHFVMVPLTLFTTAVPLPFGALGLSEQVSDQLFRLVDHPGGAVAMMGYRVLMSLGGLVSAIVYLANLRQVRALSELSERDPEGLEPIAASASTATGTPPGV